MEMVVQYVWMHHFVEKHNPLGDVAKSKGNNARAGPGSDQFALRNEMCHLSKYVGLVLLPWRRADLHVFCPHQTLAILTGICCCSGSLQCLG
jgi:hypothetical protein